jgi:murein L,D-transpeptidase YafK
VIKKQYSTCGACSGLRGIILILALLLTAGHIQAQEKVQPPPRNLKVVSEGPDGHGNIVRTVQYDQGLMRVTEQIIIPQKRVAATYNPYKIRPDTLNKDSLLIVVDKKRYIVQLFYRHRLIRAYKAVFGPQPLQNKCMEGDRCTPEGMFTIKNKNPNSRYNKFMLISYPNDAAIARFNQLKAKGSIPQSARIGGDIGIHGIWKGGDDMIEMGVGWTDGCVALKNKDIEDLYNMVGVGTKVLIKK